MRRVVPEGIRITKVGLWYVLLTVLVAIPAANTGNNALYMVEACLLALLVVSGVTSRQNLRCLDIELSSPAELFVGQPFGLQIQLSNRGRFWSRRLLVVAGLGQTKSLLIPSLDRGGTFRGLLEVSARHRGPLSIPYVHLASLYPMGLFRKGIRYRVDLELLVFPRLLPTEEFALVASGGPDDAPVSHRVGTGHELHSLRSFRDGDDRRGIHWKLSARTGDLIFMERESERGRRVSVLFDNQMGRRDPVSAGEGFELQVSRAATACLDMLKRGYEVELITHDQMIGFGRGRAHRRRILETLARITPTESSHRKLQASDPAAAVIRIGETEVRR